MAVDTLVPIAMAIGLYRRQERVHRAAWVQQSTLALGGGAYREGAPQLTAVQAPPAVRLAGCLGFVSAGASLPALLWAARPVQTWLDVDYASARSAILGLLVGVVPVSTTIGLASCAAAAAWALLACQPFRTLVRTAGALLALAHSALIVLALAYWVSFTSDLAARLSLPTGALAVFSPAAFTIGAAVAVVLWPVLGIASGVATWRAAPALTARPRSARTTFEGP
jgi:hypothetical protein